MHEYKTVHLELVGDLNTDPSIANLKHLFPKVRILLVIYSHWLANYVDTRRELKEMDTLLELVVPIDLDETSGEIRMEFCRLWIFLFRWNLESGCEIIQWSFAVFCREYILNISAIKNMNRQTAILIGDPRKRFLQIGNGVTSLNHL